LSRRVRGEEEKGREGEGINGQLIIAEGLATKLPKEYCRVFLPAIVRTSQVLNREHRIHEAALKMEPKRAKTVEKGDKDFNWTEDEMSDSAASYHKL